MRNPWGFSFAEKVVEVVEERIAKSLGFSFAEKRGRGGGGGRNAERENPWVFGFVVKRG